MSELLAVLLFVSLIVGIAAATWNSARGRLQSTTAARVTEAMIQRARMQAIYRNLNHFILLEPGTGRLALFADTGGQAGELDMDDQLVATQHLAQSVGLALPPGTLVDPLSGGTLSSAWTMPVPSGGAWTTGQRGMMVTPRGAFQSAQSEPQSIVAGTIVFSTPRNDTAAVTLRGSLGAVRAFEYFNGQWKEM